MDTKSITRTFTKRAKEVGFDFIGFSKAEFLNEEATNLEQWLNKNHHGEMAWMQNHFDKRLDPRKLVEGAKTVISFGLNYFPEKTQVSDTYKISKYAYGRDYHKVLKSKLKELLVWLTNEIGQINARAFVDSAPVMDKVWAKKSGIGWVGKHTNLINKNLGSFFFLGEIICDVEFEYDNSIKDFCGTCTRCIEACPTDAIYEPYKIDGSKCISYLTIELKDSISNEFKGKMDDWAFGCDICQDVCPWNSKSVANATTDFNANENLLNYSKSDWEEITEELFDEIFQSSAVKRTKYNGLKRNIDFLKS